MPALRTEGIHAKAQDHLPAPGTEQESRVAILRPFGLWRSFGLMLSFWGFGPFVAFCIAHFYPFQAWPVGVDDWCLCTTPVNSSACIGGRIVSAIWGLFSRSFPLELFHRFQPLLRIPVAQQTAL